MSASAKTPAMRSALGRVRGLGSARDGTGHFIGQRVSALGLVLLAPTMAVSAALGLPPGYDGATLWLQQPWNAAGAILLAIAAFYHMRIGMQVIIEDYIHQPVSKAALMVANTFLSLGLMVVSILAVLTVNFGA